MRPCLLVLPLIALLLAAPLLPGCNPPDVVTDTEVLTLMAQPRSDPDHAAMVTEGRRLFLAQSCSNCHAVQGSPHGAPVLRNLYTTRATLRDGSTIDRDRTYLIRSILHPQEQVVRGYMQPMSTYRHLKAHEVAALVAYLESL